MNRTHVDDFRARYLPTEDEIRQACEELQANWSRRDRALRGDISARPAEFPLLSIQYFDWWTQRMEADSCED